jgi:hypothetical protein
MEHFLYARHFLLLTCFSVLLAIASQLHLSSNLSLSFALYGALHASALMLSLRARQTIWRQCLFIALSASLSATTLHMGIFGGQLSEGLPGSLAPYALIGFSAVIGAVSYGLIIRLFRFYTLTARALAEIAIGCMLASFLALFTLSHEHSLGAWWLAVLWWYAFSGGLWNCDRRQQSTN